MSWQIILKAVSIPNNAEMLSYYLQKKPEELIELVKNNKISEKTHPSFVKIMRTIPNQLSAKQLFEKIPLGDSSFEEFSKNLEKLKESLVIADSTGFKILLERAKKAKDSGNETEFKQISQKIKERSRPSENKLIRDKELRALLRWFDSQSENFVLNFKNTEEINQNRKKFIKNIQKFAKLIEGTVENDAISTNFNSSQGFVQFLIKQPKDSEIKQVYSEIRQYKPDLKGLETKLSSTTETDKLFLENKTYNVKSNLNKDDVFTYLRIINNIKGNVSSMVPSISKKDKMENNKFFPDDIIFLKRVSGKENSIILSPYGELLLESSFGSNWFNLFFDTIRANAIISEKASELKIVDDIIEGLKDPSQPEQSKLGINLIPFRTIKLTNNQDNNRKKLRNFIKKDSGLSDTISSKTKEYQSNLFQEKYKNKFTTREAKEFEKYYNSLDELDQEILGELKIDYYDDFDNEVSSKESKNAYYARIFLDNDEQTPEDLKEELQKLTRDVKTSDVGIKIEQEKIKELEEEIKRRKENNKPLTNLEETLENRKKKLKEAEEAPKSQTSKVDIMQLRETLLNASEFSDYLIASSEKQKLGELEKTFSTVSSEKLTPESSLYFFGRIGDVTGNEIVFDTYEKIDELQKQGKSNEIDKLAQELEKQMPSILSEGKKQIISGFRIKIEQFGKSPVNFFGYDKTGKRAIEAISELIEAGLLTEATT